MAVVGKEDLMKMVSSIVGERKDDEALKFIEDLTDTVNDFEANSGLDWKAKYDSLDGEWRDRYKARFFGEDGGEPEDTTVIATEESVDESEDKELTLDDVLS